MELVADRDNFDLVADIDAKRRLVDGGVEALVMGAERVENLPDDAVALVVVERFLGRHASRDADGQDDIAHALALGAAHDSPHGLHNIDLALARMHEQDRIQGGDIDSLGQASGVREDAGDLVAV